MMVREGRRSLAPDDLFVTDLGALAGIHEDVQDAEFRARVADVL